MPVTTTILRLRFSVAGVAGGESLFASCTKYRQYAEAKDESHLGTCRWNRYNSAPAT
jgi:hypothetical protein